MSPGYACGCRPGFRLAKNGYSCDDIDECIEGTGRCDHQCINTPGSYKCSCLVGYDLGSDGRSCVDIDECVLMDEIVAFKYVLSEGRRPPDLSPKAAVAMDTLEVCEHPTLCLNLPGEYSCGCPLGTTPFSFIE